MFRRSRIFDALVVAPLLISTAVLGACQHTSQPVASADSTANRAPTGFAHELSREDQFRSMLAQDVEVTHLRTNYLDRLLKIYYRAELYVERIEERLDQAIAKRKKDVSYHENVLDSEDYAHELHLEATAESSLADIEYVYRRLLETQKETGAPEAYRQRASDILRDLYNWLDSRPAEDRLMLSHLYERLEATRAKATKAAILDGSMARDIASVDYDFVAANTYANDMSGFMKSHRKLIHRKALAAFHAPDKEMDAPVARVQFIDRAPSSPEPIKPQMGVWGNVTGLSFPDNEFVFTFDDGPEFTNDTRLIGYLKAHKDSINKDGIPTTFFWMVNSVGGNLDSIPLAKASKISMNNHTWTHPDLMKLDADGLNHEINESNAYLLKAFGYQPVLKSTKFRFFRCPYGSCYTNSKASPELTAHADVIRQMIVNLGLIHAYWAIDSHDWLLPHQQQRIFDLTTKQMQALGHGVILMHDIHDWTIDTAKMIFDWIKDQNDNHNGKYRLLSLEQSVDEYNAQFPPNFVPPTPTPTPVPVATPAVKQ